MRESAPAKVNLYLRLLGRREDGYHLLDSLVVFAALADTIALRPAPTLSLTIAGPEAEALLAAGGDNLVLRAARLVAAAAGRPLPRVAMRLTKRLPVAAGLGGGSADAAATLRALIRLWDLRWGEEQLAPLALTLGADVPACLASRSCRMGGIGERLAPAPPLPRLGLLLVNPRHALPTGLVFASRRGGFSPPALLPARGWQDAAALARDLAMLSNDLEPAAIALCPPIAEVLAAVQSLPGCLLARLSGSGPTVFGLFSTPPAAAAAAAALPAAWWRWGGGLYEGDDTVAR